MFTGLEDFSFRVSPITVGDPEHLTILTRDRHVRYIITSPRRVRGPPQTFNLNVFCSIIVLSCVHINYVQNVPYPPEYSFTFGFLRQSHTMNKWLNLFLIIWLLHYSVSPNPIPSINLSFHWFFYSQSNYPKHVLRESELKDRNYYSYYEGRS